jgi:hypothetical protein
LLSPENSMTFMTSTRRLYRSPIVETLDKLESECQTFDQKLAKGLIRLIDAALARALPVYRFKMTFHFEASNAQ